VGPESRVEIIAGTSKVVIIEVHDPSMVGEVGFDMGIMQVFTKHGISYILKATNANTISMAIWEKDQNTTLLSELKKKYEKVTVKKVAIVCAIGSNIAKPAVLARAAGALARNKINIEAITQSLRQVNMQFVINRNQFDKAVIALNQELCVR
jgi:aspartate kinase